jgi:rhamnogalacturonyl hydrolase YesR
MNSNSLAIDHSRASAQSEKPVRYKITRDDLLQRVLNGCDWLTDIAQVMEPSHPDYGVIRGEYDTKNREWKLYGPFWHTGQAIRLLLRAYGITGNKKYLEHSILGGKYMIRDQTMDEKDEKFHGFIHGRQSKGANTASQLEGFAALNDLYQATGDVLWLDSFQLAVDWVARNLYIKKEGLFYNGYIAVKDELAPVDKSHPTNDDAIFWIAHQAFKNPSYLQIFREVSDRLLSDEDPPGNWIKYKPCDPDVFDGRGSIHARHAWWWGYPMLQAYDAFQEQKYLDAAIRAGDWYIHNSNLDGGYYYHTTREDHNHLSYDFSTSAVGCAVIMWCDLWHRLNDERYLIAIESALGFLLRAQFNQDVSDPNIKGAYFEGYLPPDGTMEPGFYLRDIATIFSTRALLTIIETYPEDTIYYLDF